MHSMEMASFRKLFRGGEGAGASYPTPTIGPNARTGSLESLKKAASKAAAEMNQGGAAASALQASADASQALPNARPANGTKPRSIGSFNPLIAKEDVLSQRELDGEGYDFAPENEFVKASDQPLSTFSIDVDAASYANARRFLDQGRMPPQDAVRIEELINYFRYDYPEPAGEHPFSITTELSACPWKAGHKLVRVGLKGRSIPNEKLPPNNLVFLVDSSGSMESYDKLPLLKKGLRLLVEQLRRQDRIAIVAYAGTAGLVLPSTPGSDKAAILAALERLEAGGSTAGGAGIQLAYEVARRNFMEKGNNRVILATDGDFNVGITSDGELVRMIEEKRRQGVFLTVLGFGTGNYQDAKMEKLADKGNGNYAYIDDILEARKVLVQEMGATLLTIAKDVKIQVEFNPARVQAYRLIGYENRLLKAQDFNDDKKDAGELGAGHTVTALYEVIPIGAEADLPAVDELRYQKTRLSDAASAGKELLTVKFRYKKPDGDRSLLIVHALEDAVRGWDEATQDHRFSAAVAGFGMLLRGSKFAGNLTYAKVGRTAGEALGKDEGGYRAEFLRLVEKARLLDQRQR
ncbi:MAG: VWA domain-containing protein [Elusimicrobia bacterium]|nr:VWA domain-containing protein [Elusimicrobiota bacterium]